MLVPITILLLSNYVLAYDGEPKLYFDLKDAEDYFSWFMEKYNKTYTNSEAQIRFQTFKNNLKDVNERNSGLSSPVFGITQFIDLSIEEFIQKHTGFIHDHDLSINRNAMTVKDVQTLGDVPDQFDWRDHNVVTSVKAQGYCGACWAFAATGSAEAAFARKTGELIDLSPQQLVDCDRSSNGCQGGFPSNAFKSIIQLGGQEKEIDYSYTETQRQCSFDQSKVEARLTDFKSYKTDEEGAKGILYQNGPLTIAVDARAFLTYNGGILKNCQNTKLNHAVLLVGYGTENGQDYWIIKNSWGETFGENGYVRIKRGVNECGLTDYYFEHAVA